MQDYCWYHGAKAYDQDTDRRRHGETRLARPRIHTRNIVDSRAFRGRLRREFSSCACPHIGASCGLCSPDDALNAARFTVTHGCAFITRGRLVWDVLSGGDEKGRSRKRRGEHMVQIILQGSQNTVTHKKIEIPGCWQARLALCTARPRWRGRRGRPGMLWRRGQPWCVVEAGASGQAGC